jgi:hypothetical protein
LPPRKVQAVVDARLEEQNIEITGETQMNSPSAYEVSSDQVMSRGSENPWAIRNPLDEARDLHRMVIFGSSTIDAMRDLISVPPKIEGALLAYADRYPKDGQRIQCVLQFRRRVAEEFERLLYCDMSFVEGPQLNAEEDVSEAESEVQAIGAIAP